MVCNLWFISTLYPKEGANDANIFKLLCQFLYLAEIVQITRHVDKPDIMEKSQYSFAKKPYLTIALILQRSQYEYIRMTETERVGICKYFDIFFILKRWNEKDLMFQKASIRQETKDRNKVYTTEGG